MRDEREDTLVPLPRESRVDSTESQASGANSRKRSCCKLPNKFEYSKRQENVVYLSPTFPVLSLLRFKFQVISWSFLLQRPSYYIEYKRRVP